MLLRRIFRPWLTATLVLLLLSGASWWTSREQARDSLKLDLGHESTGSSVTTEDSPVDRAQGDGPEEDRAPCPPGEVLDLGVCLPIASSPARGDGSEPQIYRGAREH